MIWTAADNLLAVPINAAFASANARVPERLSDVQRRGVQRVHDARVERAVHWHPFYPAAALQEERERSLRAEAAAHHAQLEALRYQINPHFLFNALNAVSTLVTERRNDEAARMLSRVSDFLRLTLTAPVREEVALADEIDYVRQYLEIERVRFGGRLRTEIDVTPDAWEAAVPAFVLQPLIENAVRHAIAPRESGGAITIEAQRVGEMLRVAIVDDGNGVRDDGRSNGTGRSASRTRATACGSSTATADASSSRAPRQAARARRSRFRSGVRCA